MIKLFKTFRWKDWLLCSAILVLICGQVYADLALPDAIGGMINLFDVKAGGSIEVMSIVKEGMIMLGWAFMSIVCTVIIGLLASIVAARLGSRLRCNLFRKVNEFSMEEMNHFSTASLITRSTNDINQVQLMVMIILRMFITAPITAVAALIKIIGKSGALTGATGVSVLLIALLAGLGILLILPKFSKLQKQTDSINLVSQENLTGLRVIRAYNAEKLQKGKFNEKNEDLTKTLKYVNQAMAVFMPALMLIMNGLTLAITWMGSYLVGDGSIVFADISVFSMYAMQIMMSFVMVLMIGIMLPRALVSARRINQVLEKDIKINDGDGANGSEAKVGEIVFDNVSFKYPNADEYVLKNINLDIKKGETVAFIGSTGSGKSTLINLIPRFYDASEGSVIIDGVDVRQYKQDELHGKLGYVPQKALLFSGSIADNLRYSKRDATKEEMEHALKVAQADFVFKNEAGVEYMISQGGKNVSGGQKQRLSIARAIVRKPEIYIFDDSFSALDYKTDKTLRKALKQETGDATSLIVAQRIGTIRDADKIVVLNEGEMVGLGTHDELMNSCDVYREIALSQLSQEELA